jgi:isocitrate lyase
MNKKANIQFIQDDWKNNPRWDGLERPYTAEDVVKLRGSIQIEHTLAKQGAKSYGLSSILKILYVVLEP